MQIFVAELILLQKLSFEAKQTEECTLFKFHTEVCPDGMPMLMLMQTHFTCRNPETNATTMQRKRPSRQEPDDRLKCDAEATQDK